MNTQIRKFYEADEIGGGSIDWYKDYCRVNKELTELKKQVQEKDLIIHGLEDGCQNWKLEYDNCLAILSNLVKLKEDKDRHGKTESYKEFKPLAWDAAKKFIENYQHES